MKREEAIKVLRESPLFHLSLASKELFHSNFLYWMATTYPDVANKVFEELVGAKLGLTKDNTERVRREENKFDFSVHSEGDFDSLVIENKVKSMPRLSQLDDYNKKLGKKATDKQGYKNCKKCLLSLAQDFPEREEIESSKEWIIKSYEDLADAISKCSAMVSGYHGSVIDDYCNFIRALHVLSGSWRIAMNSKLLIDTKNSVEAKLRIHDVHGKIVAAHFLGLLNEKLKEVFPDKSVRIQKNIKEIKEDKYSVGKDIFTDNTYFNGLALVDVKVKFTENLALGLQIQGQQYRRLVESCDNKEPELEEYYNWWFQKEEEKEVYHGFLYPSDGRTPVCKYGTTFRY